MADKLHIFSWDKGLETGIEIVDSQHKEFLKHANTFIIKVLADKGAEAIHEEYDFIKYYLQYHFQTEETFLFDSHYPNYKEHQAEHLQMKFKAKEMELKMVGKDNQTIVDDFTDFVNTWVVSHILGSDLKFSRYYNEVKTE